MKNAETNKNETVTLTEEPLAGLHALARKNAKPGTRIKMATLKKTLIHVIDSYCDKVAATGGYKTRG